MKKNTLNYFLDLVKIASPSGEEKEMTTYLINWLKTNKFDFKVDQTGNIYAIKGDTGKPLLFSSHMDTVNPGNDIKPVIKNGIIKSSRDTILGADNKATIAAILSALDGYKGKKTIELIFSVEEETVGGLWKLSFNLIKSKYAILADSVKPLGSIITRSPFITNFYITLTGKEAHSSTPKKGVNAIVQAGLLINKIPQGTLDDGETTINIGVINGGTGINTIPGKVEIKGEIRTYDSNKYLLRLNFIKKILSRMQKDSPIKTSLVTDGYFPGYTHQKSDPFIKKIMSLYDKLNFQTKFYKYSAVSDANILNSKGIQAINLGDGVHDPHSVNESISVNDLEKLSNIISAIIYIEHD